MDVIENRMLRAACATVSGRDVRACVCVLKVLPQDQYSKDQAELAHQNRIKGITIL